MGQACFLLQHQQALTFSFVTDRSDGQYNECCSMCLRNYLCVGVDPAAVVSSLTHVPESFHTLCLVTLLLRLDGRFHFPAHTADDTVINHDTPELQPFEQTTRLQLLLQCLYEQCAALHRCTDAIPVQQCCVMSPCTTAPLSVSQCLCAFSQLVTLS
jgi:hypothetical protein